MSKVGDVPSKFEHARPLCSVIICYVHEGWTDGWTKAMLVASFPMVGGIINITYRCPRMKLSESSVICGIAD